jgi:hypothetical protein
LRLRIAGFIPEYFWSYKASPSTRNVLPQLRLQTGASIAGFVRTDTDEPATDATVDVLSLSGQSIVSATGDKAIATKRRRQSPLQAKTSPRGFFQIRDVPPGEFRLAARRGTVLGMGGAHVEAEKETRLRDFLVLESPFDMDVSIEPAVPPDGPNWTLKVVRRNPFPDLLHQHLAPISGVLSVGPLTRGEYSLEVWSGDHRWFIKAVAVDGPPAPVVIRLPVVHVRGRLTLGSKPLAGTVVFGGSGSALAIPMEADSAGRFSGSLPRGGEWPVAVEATTPAVRRNLARVSIEAEEGVEAEVRIDLPDTVLRGRVVDDLGVGVRAFVTVTPETAQDHPFQVAAESNSDFEVRGLEEGRIGVQAVGEGRRRSALMQIELAAGRDRDVTLVVLGDLPVRGRLLSTTGVPLAGATILAYPSGGFAGSRYYTTDAGGEFALSLPSGTRDMKLIYWADGYPLDFTQATVSTEPLMLTLAPVGGLVSLGFGREIDVTRSDDPVVVVSHGGAQFPVSALFMMTLRRGVLREIPPSPKLEHVDLPVMAAGEYAVCVQSRPDFFAGRPPGPACSSGTLEPGGKLALDVPASSHREE